ncbi:MAG TPA: S-methyl-5-thioribose-1-phosphate isomerase [Gammaproteobacteria bacterium]|nr:S-methyl-5-thioribose-1-phosphate isomerase [Gammaproteobacteria bacterium]
MTDTSREPLSPLRWENGVLMVLDQRALPGRTEWLVARSADDVVVAIRDMAVRGAPAIGIAAAWGVVLAAHSGGREGVVAALPRLAAARPTAVNLHWALERMEGVLGRAPEAELATALEAEARLIQEEDLAQNRRMAELGAAFIAPGARVLTHCNTGALATAGIGTALGVIREAHRQGKLAAVYATETRPWMQGARLTIWELSQEGIPATLITEGAAGQLMQREGIDWLIVGADRITANGDTANKIGTYSLAVLAKAHGAKVMVVAPGSTIDLRLPDGGSIPIEQREAAEILRAAGLTEAPPGIAVSNPAFDVTPALMIDVIVTERGAVEQPGAGRMQALFSEQKQ